MHTTPSTSPRMAKSTSLAVLEHNHDMHIVDQDDIIGLTQDVKTFSDGLAKLKAVCTEEYGNTQAHECEEDMRVVAHERLGDVLCTLKSVLQRYPPLNTTELFSAAATLIGKIKSYNYEDHSVESMENAFSDAIDQLALEFSSSVSEYLMGDLHHGIVEDVKTKVFSTYTMCIACLCSSCFARSISSEILDLLHVTNTLPDRNNSYDNLLSVSQETTDKDETEDEKEEIVQLTPDQIDATLMNLQAGLELAFQRAKAWSKYLKDVMSYIERRAQLEVEYSKNLSRLAASVKPQLTEEGFLPLQSVYCTVLSQDVEYAKTCQATFTMLQTSKFVEPLTARKNEHDKVRKVLKETWNKEVKRMNEAVSNLKKAQTMYVTRQQEYEKAKELSQKTESDLLNQSLGTGNVYGKIDKRKKAEEDTCHKAAEAETTYKACVAEANNRQTDVQRIKGELLAAIREQIFFSDQAIRKVTIEYFQLLQTVSAPVPVQYHTLCEASKRYEAGSQYAEFVRRLPTTSSTPVDYEEYKFEPYHTTSNKVDVGVRKTSTQSNESASSEHHSQEGSPNLSSPRRDKYRVPVKAWGQQGFVLNSDTDSQSGSSKSLDSSPSSSPYPTGNKKLVLTGSMDDLIEDTGGVKKLLAVPGTEQLSVQSIVKRQGRRNTTFGVDFQEQVEHYHSAIPPIISKSLKEVEKRGITVKGIYRVSGVKSTVENLCQRFEMDPESVSLENENPNVISNVLKLYLRQLPEPLLTFKLYPNFISVAKENMSGGCSKDVTVEKLHNLIDQLPYSNRKTLGVLMHHLQRVAAHVEQNQMNASNLGIVFGPTLLRPQGGNASLACLVDTPHQTRVVELLIVSADSLFGPSEDHQLIPGETAIEQLEKLNTLIVPTPVTLELPKDKSEPKKENVPSPSVMLPKEQLIPPNVPQLSANKDGKESSPIKKSGDEFNLPGSAHLDKGGLSPKSSPNQLTPQFPTEGDDIDITNGLTNQNSDDNAIANENSTDSDIQSDDDLLLPDDSHHSNKSQLDMKSLQEDYPIKKTFLTSPSVVRKSRLPSPASSPNLSSRSAYPFPPSIRVDGSVLGESFDSSLSKSPPSIQKIYQLPPINSWVPKGESLFTSILDSRSPQVYRRTNTSTKPASYPVSPQPPGTAQSPRISWPQSSNIQPGSQTVSPATDMKSSLDMEKHSPSIEGKSPRLLKKCTSFDMERSKPFPNRSSMTSPMLKRKGMSVDETDGLAVSFILSDSPQSHRKSAIHEMEQSEHDESKLTSCETVVEVPQCLSIESMKTPESAILTTFPSLPGESFEKGINQSNQDTKRSDIPIEMRVGIEEKAEYLIESKPVESSTEGGAKPKVKSKTVEKSTKPTQKSKLRTEKEKTKEKANAQKSDHKEESSKDMKKESPKTKPMLKHTKKESTTSSVKSALMSSAAKLKALGKRSPVTLLSYKSHSITIPDQTTKSRPSSMSSLGTRSTKKLVHQSESSPTVLQSTSGHTDKTKNMSKVKRSATADYDITEDLSSTPSPAEVKKSEAAVGKKEITSKLSSSKSTSLSKITPKATTSAKIQTSQKGKKPSLTSETKETVRKDHVTGPSKTVKQAQNIPARTVSSAVSRPQKVTAKSTSAAKKDSTSVKSIRDELSTSADDKRTVRYLKRGSVTSIQSDSSRKSDSVRDCCSCKKNGEKKPDYLHERKRVMVKK